MEVLKYIGYTLQTAAIAGALYITSREVYKAGFEKGNSVGQQTAARKILRNIDGELMHCKVVDGRHYNLPSFRKVERTTSEGMQDDFLELRVDCGYGPLSIPLRKVKPQLSEKSPLGW